MMKKLLLSCIICLTNITLWAQIVPDANGIVYVKATAVGLGNGSSWANATANLQNAINATGTSKVYVAAGTYQPASGISYNMKNGVAIYGAFPNTGTPVFANRNTTANETILKGNNASVIKNLNLDATAILDGFTVTSGNAFGANGTTSAGPPIFPGLPNTTIFHNGENGVGGGIYNENSSASFSNLIISDNIAKGGNGFLGSGGSGTPGAGLGGGMYNSNSSPKLTYVIIKNNTALGGNYIGGGGFGGGGGILNTNSSSPILTNVVLSDNKAQSGENYGSANGGAMKNQTSSSPVLTNVTIVNNKALVGTTNGGTQNTDGGAIINENSSNPIIRNCIIYGNNTGIANSSSTPVITYSLVQGLAADETNHNIDGTYDPLFTSTSDFNVKIGSPAVNLGNHSYYATGQTPDLSAVNLDLGGNVRIQKGKIDLGAYESPFEIIIKPDVNGVIYVKTAATGISNGTSWANATNELQNAINATGANKVYVAAGNYQPANGISYQMKNGVAIYGGFPNTGTPVFADRNTTANESILKGNNASVLKNSNLDATAVLDGFTVTGGYASGENGSITSPPFDPMNPGGGFPTVTNGGNGYGGGIYNDRTSASFNNLIIKNNTAKGGNGANNGAYSSFPGSGFGGGIYNSNSSPKITNVIIKGNEANGVYYINGGSHGYGAGIYNTASSAPILTNVIVSNNKAQGGGGGAGGNGQGGGINNQGASIPILTNVTIAYNSSLKGDFINNNGEGGAIYNAGSSNLIIKNSIIYGNNTGVHNNSSAPVITYSLVQGLAADATNHNLDGATNPMFVSSSDYQLQINSAAINKGSNSYYAAAQTPDLSAINTDLAGKSRISGTVDMGAYEFQIPVVSPNAIVYVSQTGSGTKDGSSWANATYDLQQAILNSTAKVYVAGGTYKPIYPANTDFSSNYVMDLGNRANAFVLKNNIKIYGGFNATTPEASPNLRDTTLASTHKSILSGDLNGDDGTDFTNNSENARHVVISSNEVGAAELNGFTITGGNASGTGTIAVNNYSVINVIGGGIYNVFSNPTLNNVIVQGNSALTAGGIYNISSNAKISNTVIRGNKATSGGAGGILNNNNSHSILTNVMITGNVANNQGGGMQNTASNPVLTNVTISGNTAASGGAIGNDNISNPKIRNSIIYGNSSGIVNDNNSNIIMSYSLAQGLAADATNHNLDGATNPLFSNPPAHSTTPFTGGDYNLQATSPVINMGDEGFYASGQTPNLTAITTDLAGNTRIQKGKIDLGTYESAYDMPLKPDANGIVYVKTASTGSANGSSWANATGDLQKAIQQTTAKVYVAAGTYVPSYTPDDLTLQTPKNRDNSFVLKNNIKIYGCFSATAPEANPSLRDTSASSTNKSILSGDFDGDDVAIFAHNTENAKHVVYAEGNVGTALLNGFTISGGNADASLSGGGIYLSDSNPTLTNLTIIGNNAASNGGGIYNRYSGANSNPILTNVNISGNQAGNNGGGIYNDSGTMIITNAVINGNLAGESGGGFQNGDGTVTITNLTMSGNAAAYGGGLFNHVGSVKVRNSIIYGNSSGVDNGDVKPIISYSILQGSGGSSAWSATKASDGGNNLDVDPMFTNAPNFSTAPFIGGDYTLQIASPALNTGSNTFYAALQTPNLSFITTDLGGKQRINGIIDMGAYEFEGSLPVSLVNYTAKIESMGVRLDWQTASEHNHDYYIISRSNNGINFYTIGKVIGSADKNISSNYTLLDKTPEKGTNYYKLVQVDIDGEMNELGIKAVNMELESLTEIVIYPNPSSEIVYISFNHGVYAEAALIDLNGHILTTKEINETEHQLTFDLNNLKPATYLIRLSGVDGNITKQIIKN